MLLTGPRPRPDTDSKQQQRVLLTPLSHSSFQRAIWTRANVHTVDIQYTARVPVTVLSACSWLAENFDC